MELLKKLLLIIRFAIATWLIITAFVGAVLIVRAMFNGGHIYTFNTFWSLESITVCVGMLTGFSLLMMLAVGATFALCYAITLAVQWLFTGNYKF